MGVAITAAAAAFALLGCALAWSYVWRVRQLTRLDASPLATRLGRLSIPERAALIVDLAPAGSWERELCQELQDTDDDRLRLLAVNDQLSWLEHQLSARARWPGVATLIVLAGWLLVGIAGYLTAAPPLDLLYASLVALCGVSGCVMAHLVGRRHAARARKRIDALIEALIGELDDAELGLIDRRRGRRQRRSMAASDPLTTRGPGTPFGMG